MHIKNPNKTVFAESPIRRIVNNPIGSYVLQYSEVLNHSNCDSITLILWLVNKMCFQSLCHLPVLLLFCF